MESVRKWIRSSTEYLCLYSLCKVKCIVSVRKWTRSCTEDFCSYYLLEVYAEDLCVYSLLKVHQVSDEMDQELRRGFMFIFLKVYESVWKWTRSSTEDLCYIFIIKSVWNQSGNGPGAAQRTSVHIKEMHQEFHRGFMLIFSIKSVWNQ
jgi:hypothetical protein